MSSSNEAIVLFDLPSRDPCKCWSLNPWKTRLLLNYKGIPYTTRWTSYPDVKDTISPHVKPHPEGHAIKPYTIPTVILPDGTYVQESLTIADKIDELFPEPSLKIHTPVLDKVMVLIKKVVGAAAPDYMYRIPERLLPTRDAEYWHKDRGNRVGMPLKDFQEAKGGEQVSKAVAEDVRAIGELLKANGGPFFEGEQVTYVDFVWGGFLKWLTRVGDDCFDIVIQEHKDTHVRLLEEIDNRGWLKRDDH